MGVCSFNEMECREPFGRGDRVHLHVFNGYTRGEGLLHLDEPIAAREKTHNTIERYIRFLAIYIFFFSMTGAPLLKIVGKKYSGRSK